jgi:signal peptidase I
LVAYFAPGGENGAHAGEALLGRVAGVPGDDIKIEDGQILVKGERTGVAAESTDGNERDAARWLKKKFSTVPHNSYLVLVDADAKAPDSRTVGWIPRDHLIGRVSGVWWPPHRIRRFSG